MFVFVLLILLLGGQTVQDVESFDGLADEVHSLPKLTFAINYRHFSGYLEAGNGSHLHYWFFMSRTNVSGDPLLLWLNGGPGASSLLGALDELGPLRLTRAGELVENKYAWNQAASVLFIESPAGVGFSYNEFHNYHF